MKANEMQEVTKERFYNFIAPLELHVNNSYDMYTSVFETRQGKIIAKVVDDRYFLWEKLIVIEVEK